MITTKKSLRDLRQQQHDAFHKDEPGSWFTTMTQFLNNTDFGKDGALAINLGDGDARVFDAQGNPVPVYEERTVKTVDSEGQDVKKKVDELVGYLETKHRGWSAPVLQYAIPGCVPCSGTVFGARIGSGILVAVGLGDTSKTPFAYALAEELAGDEGYYVVRLGEPLSGYTTDLSAATNEIVKAIMAHKVIVIDSIKDVLGTARGNATSSGISRGAYQFISDLGTIAATRGCVIIVPVNPSSSDPRIAEMLVEATKSNATMLAQGEGSTWTIYSRTGEGLLRTATKFKATFEEGDLVMSLSVPGSNHKPGQTRESRDLAVTSVISAHDYETIIQKITRH